MTLELTSPAFDSGETIPTQYTCQGENISPPLTLRGIPEGTESLVLVLDDPDASSKPDTPFSHWVIYDLPPDLEGLPEGFSSETKNPRIGTEGSNSFEKQHYEGPCPPQGSPHHYVFRLFAIKGAPDMPAGAHRSRVLETIREHVLEETEYVGLYAADG